MNTGGALNVHPHMLNCEACQATGIHELFSTQAGLDAHVAERHGSLAASRSRSLKQAPECSASAAHWTDAGPRGEAPGEQLDGFDECESDLGRDDVLETYFDDLHHEHRLDARYAAGLTFREGGRFGSPCVFDRMDCESEP